MLVTTTLVHRSITFTIAAGKYITGGPECTCGNRNWNLTRDSASCGACQQSRDVASLQGYILDGPSCTCGRKDWFIGTDEVRCTNCNRTHDVHCHDTILNGPACSCGAKDWFVGTNDYVCADCAQRRKE